MARKKRRKRSVTGAKQPSLLGSLLLELVAIAGFIMLMSVASSGQETTGVDLADAQSRTRKYGSMIKGYLSDQIQRTGFVAN